MQTVTGVLKGVFNFFVGDWIILGGVIFTVLIVAVLENSGQLQQWSGWVLLVGLALTLVATLGRELRS